MPRYHFRIEDGRRDRVPAELVNLRAARNEAARLAGEMLRDQPDEFWKTPSWTITVEDANGLALFVLEVTGVASVAARGD